MPAGRTETFGREFNGISTANKVRDEKRQVVFPLLSTTIPTQPH